MLRNTCLLTQKKTGKKKVEDKKYMIYIENI